MSVSKEWNSLKAAWIILLLMLAFRIFLSSRFLLTPVEAGYWYAGQEWSTGIKEASSILTGAVRLTTSLFGNTELAVRLPSALALTLASFYLALLAASMFSWHTALHVTLLFQGILQFNLAAVTATPTSLLLPCWCAVCYHASQGMNDNRTGEWLFAGFWFGIGLLCEFTMILLLPCLILCFILIKPYRICLFFPGPWIGLLLAFAIFAGMNFWQGTASLSSLAGKSELLDMAGHLVPDPAYSIRFLADQFILLTPVVLLLTFAGWISAPGHRQIVKPDSLFLILTSCPFFLLYLIFPVFADTGVTWSATAYMTAIVLIGGLYSSTRSSFKGRPHRRWTLAVVTAYCITLPPLLQIAYPSLPLPVQLDQTRLQASGWDILGKEIDRSASQLWNGDNTFIFTMEPRLSGELAFYMPVSRKTVSLDHRTRADRSGFLENEMRLAGQNGIGLVATRAGIEQVRSLFARIEVERELTIPAASMDHDASSRTYYIVRGFDFRIR